LPPKKIGTIYIKTQLGPFEYFRDEKKTAESRRGNFVTIGDVGYLSEDGWLYLCDRKADMIISGGVNIYPVEIEGVFLNHPSVGDVAVFGIPDDDWGESVMAVVEPAEGAQPGPELAQELLAFAKERLAKYKLPKSIDFRKALPRQPSGKLYKRFLRDEYWKGRDRQI